MIANRSNSMHNASTTPPSTERTYIRGVRRFLTLLGVAALALTACGSDDKPAATIPAGVLASAPDTQLADMILSWCIAGYSSTKATQQAMDAGMTAHQAELAVEQLERMKAATDQC